MATRSLYLLHRRQFLRISLISLTGMLLLPDARSEAQNKVSATAVAWSPDGTTLAVGTNAGVYLYDADLKPRALIPDSGADISALAWHGDMLAAGRYDGAIRLFDVHNGRRLLTLRGHIGVVNAISWRSDGSQVATAGDDLSVRIWDAQSGAALQTLQKHRDRVYTVAWQPNGNYLVSGAADNAVFLWDVTTGLVQPTAQRHSYYVYSVAWSPDGSHYASASRDKSVRVWGADGSQTAGYTTHTDRVIEVMWSADSQSLISASWDRTLQVWSLDQREPRLLISDLPERPRQISIDPMHSNYAAIAHDSVSVRAYGQ
ncbi:MAG: WD40 repeat domain-containing protein [Anaerolineae bacterium]|nr:WD40 repeat domain-containing protein [Anaerolineae bacterium]